VRVVSVNAPLPFDVLPRRPTSFGQRRGLLTAITYIPPTRYLPRETPFQPTVLTQLLDVSLAWATNLHPKEKNDTVTHALVLVSKSLVPDGKTQFRAACLAAPNLTALDNYVVGVVDCVGHGKHGIAVLATTGRQGARFVRIPGPEIQELRVGRWHSKDAEEEDTKEFDFDDVLASIRQDRTRKVEPQVRNPEDFRNHFVFTLGNTFSLTELSREIKRLYCRSDIVLHFSDISYSRRESG
jgi:hypothetical protein